LPAETEAKLMAILSGSLAPGIVGILEWAMQEITKQSAHLTILN